MLHSLTQKDSIVAYAYEAVNISYNNHDSDENEESMQEFVGNKIMPTLSEHSKIIDYVKECFYAKNVLKP